jgi:glutamate synthase domain-containing protein 2
MSPRKLFVWITLLVFSTVAAVGWVWPPVWWSAVVFGPLALLGVLDMVQRRHAIRANFPVIGRLRYAFEAVRPEIQQYFVESDTTGTPFNRDLRSLVYQRAKNVRDTVPFGTQLDVYAPGYEWIEHSLRAKELHAALRVTIGGRACSQPYDASILNISAMSYGSLSGAAVTALNRGAQRGGFAHNTGEGGISPYHLQGGDLIWQIGTGYFGARSPEGGFDRAAFERNAGRDVVKMIEIKLSQGAKPGHGGILPGNKVTPEIAAIRGVPVGKTVYSPPGHTAFGTPRELVRFIATLRELSGGKPIGFKLCVGRKREFMAICKAMLETGITPDYIAVDGGEGGTGAAPLEFSNRLGSPLTEGLVFVHNALVGCGLRDEIRLIAGGKIITGFHMARVIAIGADLCYSARGMMFALGCIQARLCHSNTCPTGVATQDPDLTVGLDPTLKSERVAHFHANTVKAFGELLGAAGFEEPAQLRPWHIHRRISLTRTQHYGELFDYLPPRALLQGQLPPAYAGDWAAATADAF